MIPCQVCGKDSGAHWVIGYIPAPDSQKVALCVLHDTPENRKNCQKTWQLAMQHSIETTTRNAAYYALRALPRMVTILFSGGGSLSVPCLECGVTDHDALKVIAPDGSLSFFPMQQIRRYSIRDMTHEDMNETEKTP